MPFDTRVDYGPSVRDLALAGAMRSLHVGNQYWSNTLQLSAGMRAVAYDRNFGRRDFIYRPDHVLYGGTLSPIAPREVLMTHAQIQPLGMEHPFARVYPTGRRAAEAHLATMHKLVPVERSLWTQHKLDPVEPVLWTNYLAKHADLVLAVYEIVAGHYPGLWSRFIRADGTVERRPATSWQEITRDGLYGFSEDNFGWIPDNVLNVLVSSVVEATLHDTDTVLHASGVQMYGYVDRYSEQLNELYDLLVPAFAGAASLPHKLDFVVIPTYEFRTGYITKAQKQAIQALWTLFEDWQVFNTSGRERLISGASGSQRHQVGRTLKRATTGFRSEAKQLLTDCRIILEEPADPTRWSHLDLLGGQRIHVLPKSLDVPLSYHVKFMEFMRKANSAV